MDYLIGDVQGCDDALAHLLAKVDFSPSRDKVCLLGDLVNRGPGSLRTLQRLQGLGDSATCLLGNHDLHLLAVAQGVRKLHRSDTVQAVLESPERDAWLDWLRHRPLAVRFGSWLCVHAGVVPQWRADDTLALAAEVQDVLRGHAWRSFLSELYGNQPDRWDAALVGQDRWRFIVNVLTRIRFLDAQGRMDFKAKGGLDAMPEGGVAWFDAPGRLTAGTPIACGHWSAIGLQQRADLLSLDTGCVWGGALTAVRVDGGRREVVQVPCASCGAED